MSITAEKKQEVIKDNAQGKADTGSPEVQVAILTERINGLSEHMLELKKAALTSRPLFCLFELRLSLN